jgi:hypothetical protein
LHAQEFSPEHVQQLLDQLLQRDLQPLLQQQQQLGDAGQQFVMSRALKLGAYLHEDATAAHKQQLLQAAAVAGARGSSLLYLVHVGSAFRQFLHLLKGDCMVLASLIKMHDPWMDRHGSPVWMHVHA